MTADGGPLRALARKPPPAESVLWLLVGCVVVVAVQVVVSVAGDTRAFSGSDAGGRAAAIAAAADGPGCDHDLGYWAAAWDPDGRIHPMVNTEAVGRRFVQPASISYVCAATPLAQAFGLPAALAVSVAGVLMAGVGAWMLERMAGTSGLLSLVLVGVIGSVAFYGADAWEHAPGVGLAVLGTALILSRQGRVAGVLGGVLWGFAIAARTETAAVALGLAVGVLVVAEVRRRLFGDRWRVALTLTGVIAALLADRLLQQAYAGGDYRSGRTASQVGDALGGMEERARDALTTTVGVLPTSTVGVEMLLGACFVGVLLVLGAVVAGARIERRVVVGCAAVAAVIVVMRILDPGFVPGLFPAAPVAALGVFTVCRRAAPPAVRAVAIGSLVAIPAVWAVQWTGNLAPQWGGRYLLLSAALLTVCGAALIGGQFRTVAAGSSVFAAVAIGLMGLVWHVQRTQIFAEVIEDVIDLPCDDVMISASPYLLREGGAFPEIRTGVRLDGCRLLTTTIPEIDFALDVARAAGATDVVLVGRGTARAVPAELRPHDVVSWEPVDLGDVPHTIFRIRLDPVP